MHGWAFRIVHGHSHGHGRGFQHPFIPSCEDRLKTDSTCVSSQHNHLQFLSVSTYLSKHPPDPSLPLLPCRAPAAALRARAGPQPLHPAQRAASSGSSSCLILAGPEISYLQVPPLSVATQRLPRPSLWCHLRAPKPPLANHRWACCRAQSACAKNPFKMPSAEPFLIPLPALPPACVHILSAARIPSRSPALMVQSVPEAVTIAALSRPPTTVAGFTGLRTRCHGCQDESKHESFIIYRQVIPITGPETSKRVRKAKERRKSR